MKPTTLKSQLLIALVVPALLVIAVVAFFADAVAQGALEQALSDRLSAIAMSASLMINHRLLSLQPGQDDSRTSRKSRAKLTELKKSTGTERVLVVRNEEVLLDTSEKLKIGDEYTRARFDAAELQRVRAGETLASVLFQGPDGRPYKTGYAPLHGPEGKIVGYTAALAPATYTDAIDDLRATMAGIAVLGLGLLIGLALLSARRVAVPLSDLSKAAERIGEGNLSAEIPTEGPKEAVVLSRTMRSMAASLKMREEEMQMMLAGIAHEVRNPLGGIQLFGGLLKEDLEGDKRQKHVMKILRELGVLTRVVNDFLDFARRRVHEPQRANLHELLFEVASLAEKDTQDKGVQLKLEADKQLEVMIDPEAFKGAVLNLVRNAIQAAPKEDGRVQLSASQAESGGFRLTVSDNGKGVPEEKREEIFAPFFTTKQKGTGLGLALVRKTVLAHEGTISVETSELGGARFVIDVPPATQ